MCYKMQCRVDVQCNFACIGKSKKRKSCAALLYKKYILLSFQNHILCSDLLLYVNQVDWFNYVSLLQWKVSNHEVSLLYITSFGFCCVHRNRSHQTSVWSCGMPLIYRYKGSAFPFSCMHWRVIFRTAWLRDWFSTCLNLVTLLRCCSGLQLLTHFLFGIHEYFSMYKNSECLMWQI